MTLHEEREASGEIISGLMPRDYVLVVYRDVAYFIG